MDRAAWDSVDRGAVYAVCAADADGAALDACEKAGAGHAGVRVSTGMDGSAQSLMNEHGAT
jgi:hypothetical protein